MRVINGLAHLLNKGEHISAGRAADIDDEACVLRRYLCPADAAALETAALDEPTVSAYR